MVCKICGVGAPAYCPICFLAAKGSTANTGGTQPTDVQQLKAEIAALIEWYDIPRELAIEQRTVNRAQLLEKLRQLSAV